MSELPNVFDGPIDSFLIKGVGRSIVAEHFGPDKIVSREQFSEALSGLNLIEKDGTLLRYEDILEWHRGGAETYIATGRVISAIGGERLERTFLAKAIVTSPSDPETTANNWAKRLELLSRVGVNRPMLYSNHRACLYQEYIPDHFSEVWKRSNDVERTNYTFELAKIYAALDACGFRPISYNFHDLMFQRSAIYLVDVGQDLGDWDFDNPHNRGMLALRTIEYFPFAYSRQLMLTYQEHFERVREMIVDLLPPFGVPPQAENSR